MLLPLSFNLDGRKLLLVGGGKAAVEKFMQLKRTASELTIISPAFCDELTGMLSEPSDARITVEQRAFMDQDLEGVFMVFSAVDDEAVAEHIFRLARAKQILINSADDKSRCDFYTNALIDRGSVQLSVSTGGRFAGLAAVLRRHLEAMLPQELDRDWEKVFELRERALALQSVSEKKSVITNIVREIETRYFKGENS